MGARLSTATPDSPGLLRALRAMGGTVGEILHIRGALFAVELREEVERRKRMLLLAALGFAFLHTALLVVTLLVVVLFWDTYRIAAIGATAAIYLGCGAAAVQLLRGEAAASPAPFGATLAELEQDIAGLQAAA